MNKIVWGSIGTILLGVLAYGTVKTYVIDPKTVSSVEEILELFYETRATLPPLPFPVSSETIAEQLATGRVDFIATPNWSYRHDGGTYYLADNSKLAKELQLPAKLLAYEDLAVERLCLQAFRRRQKSYRVLPLWMPRSLRPWMRRPRLICI